MSKGKRWDVVAFGEAMLRFTPPGAQRLEQAAEYRVYVGGSEANVAVGMARLGLQTAWIGKLPKNPLGRRVAAEIAAQGVDVSRVVWTDTGRVGTYYVEVAGAPRGSQVVYDRQNSAACSFAPEDLDWSILKSARHLHISGITPALSASCAATTRRILEKAKEIPELTVSFDVNYRSKLWTPEEARATLTPLLNADVVFCTLDDAETVFGQYGNPEEVARRLRELWGAQIVVLTLGSEGAVLVSPSYTGYGKPHKVDPVDRVGAGDAYVAGFLYGYLQLTLETALRYGSAMAAWKYSEPGDFCYASRSDIEAIISEENRDIRR
ncbi:MAG TPA: sugar kinase [Firmicutes bacterium]|nr:sugar kinase [Bacillota bacterium]